MLVKGGERFHFGNAWTEVPTDIHLETLSQNLVLCIGTWGQSFGLQIDKLTHS